MEWDLYVKLVSDKPHVRIRTFELFMCRVPKGASR